MEILRDVVVLVHLVGFAILFGAWVVELPAAKRTLTRAMSIGMTIATIAGLALAAPWGLADGDSLNYPKLGTKLVILLVIGALLGIGAARQKRGKDVAPVIFWLVGLLTLVNAGIAVLWG